MKNIIKHIIIVIIISTCLYMLRNLIITSPYPTLNAFMESMDITACVFVAVVITAILFLYAYRTPALSEQEYQKKIYAYLYASFTHEEQQILDAMSEEDKGRFIEEYLKVQIPENKEAMIRALGKYQFPSIPDTLKPVRKIMGVVIIVVVIWGGYMGWQKFGPEIQADYAAQEAARNEIIEDQVLYIDGLPPIELRGNNTFKKMMIDKIIEENIKTQPAVLMQYTRKIILCSDDNFISSLSGFNNFSEDKTTGFATSLDSAIYIKVSKVDTQTITHELSHIFDYVKNTSSNALFSNLWTNFKGKFEFPSSEQDYYNSSVIEFFAECSNLYFNNTEYLKTNAEEIYKFFNDLYA